jgi:hypothetical protein
MKTAGQLKQLPMIQRLEYGTVHLGQVDRLLGGHAPLDSTPSGGATPNSSTILETSQASHFCHAARWRE